jgi:hypothetical protein
VTPLDVILGNQASAIIVLAVVGAALLAFTAATLDFLSGTSRMLAPFVFEQVRGRAFVWLGMPAAFVLIGAGGALGALTSASSEVGRGVGVLLWIVNAAFVIGVLICGLCSPLARHWGFGVAGFAAGIGALMLFLPIISALGLGDAAGLIVHAPDRIVFGVAVGGVFLGVAAGAASLLALAAYCTERIALLLRAHRAIGGGMQT